MLALISNHISNAIIYISLYSDCLYISFVFFVERERPSLNARGWGCPEATQN